MAKITNYRVYLDGIDKCGKDLICSYITYLAKYKYLIKARGIISMIAYSKIYGREYEYDLKNEENVINILLTVDYTDWLVRHSITKETDMVVDEFMLHSKSFWAARNQLIHEGYSVPVYNTSLNSPYQIAKDIIKNLERLERGESWINEL